MLHFFISFMIFFGISGIVFAKPKTPTSFQADSEWVGKELKKMGLSKGFIAESMKYYEPESFEKVLTLNLLGFLKPPGQHMNLVTPQSVRETSKFMAENQKAFTLAKTKYQVPANVISALLWIETRHGDDVGRFHIVSVYLHLLQADRPKNRKELTLLALDKNKKGQDYSDPELKILMSERTQKKKLWAKEQIIALAAIRKKKHLELKDLRGSYAGAMGLPQFIPSSYRDFAKSIKPEATPNLSDSGDAIMSVAFYLSEHGWENRRADSKVTALMKYNNSRDYADSILEISKRVKNQVHKDRSLSSTENPETP